MNMKTPWTGSRIASVVIGGISLLVTLFGMYWLLGGLGLIGQGNANPKDVGAIGGLFLEFAGIGLIIVGGVLTLLFAALYKSTTRRLRRAQSEAPGTVGASPDVISNPPTE